MYLTSLTTSSIFLTLVITQPFILYERLLNKDVLQQVHASYHIFRLKQAGCAKLLGDSVNLLQSGYRIHDADNDRNAFCRL